MNAHHDADAHPRWDKDEPPAGPVGHNHGGESKHGGHRWMMIACCFPMLIIAIALVATGVVRPSFLVFAVICTAAMAMMMRGMHGDDGHGPAAR
jgi:hypothetical protein